MGEQDRDCVVVLVERGAEAQRQQDNPARTHPVAYFLAFLWFCGFIFSILVFMSHGGINANKNLEMQAVANWFWVGTGALILLLIFKKLSFNGTIGATVILAVLVAVAVLGYGIYLTGMSIWSHYYQPPERSNAVCLPVFEYVVPQCVAARAAIERTINVKPEAFPNLRSDFPNTHLFARLPTAGLLVKMYGEPPRTWLGASTSAASCNVEWWPTSLHPFKNDVVGRFSATELCALVRGAQDAVSKGQPNSAPAHFYLDTVTFKERGK